MLESFQIRNFRLFQDLTVKKLGRVNLVVGRNNAGKSAFLEAVELYASNASSSVLLELIESRQETWFSPLQSHYSDLTSHPVRHLFFDRRLPQFGKEGISLGEVSSDQQLHLETAAYQNKNDDEGTIRSVRVPHEQLEQLNLLLQEEPSSIEIEPFLVAQEGKKTRRLFRLDRLDRLIRERLSEREELRWRYTWQFVSTDKMPNQKLAALWDLTSLTDLESEVISALGLIDERVSGIAFVEESSKNKNFVESIRKRLPYNERIPLVKLKGIDEPLPLKSMGDGMSRLFHIILALVNAHKGLLLIDEFENGLHWTIQPKLWDIVFQLSEKLNVQVFATTHSRDCIEGFDRAWNNYPELGSFFRLDRKGELVKATEYTSETLSDAIEMDVEIR